MGDDLDAHSFEFLLACCIGDGTLHRAVDKRSGTERVYYSLRFNHSLKQKKYLEYKATRLNEILGSKGTVRSFDNNGYPGVRFSAGNTEILQSFFALLYPNGKKTVTEECLGYIGLPGLAVWWMDDGSLTIRKKRTASGTTTNGARLGYLSTYTDTKSESMRIGAWINALCGAEPKLAASKGKTRLMFNSHDLRRLCPAINPFVIPSMKYKVDLGYIYQRRSPTSPSMFTPKHLRK